MKNSPCFSSINLLEGRYELNQHILIIQGIIPSGGLIQPHISTHYVLSYLFLPLDSKPHNTEHSF